MSSQAQTKLFQVSGLWCSSCAKALERATGSIPGIEASSVDFATHTLRARGQSENSFAELIKRTLSLGYSISPFRDVRDSVKTSQLQFRQELVRAAILSVFTFWTMAFALVEYFEPAGPLSDQEFRWYALASGLLASTGIAFGANKIYTIGLLGLARGKPTIDSLLCLTSISCLAISFLNFWQGSRDLYFDSAIGTLALVACIRAGSSFLSLKQLSAIFGSFHGVETQLRLSDGAGNYALKPLATALPGSLVQVNAGEVIPVDGSITGGSGTIQTALLTGESEPTNASPGKTVLAGETLLAGSLEIRVEKAFGQRHIDLLSRETIESFHDDDTPSFIENALGFAAPTLLIVSIAWLPVALRLHDTWQNAVVSSLSLLIVGCPCALYFALNIPLLKAQVEAPRRCYLLYRPRRLDQVAKVNAIALDKTGTLTNRAPELTLLANDTQHSEAEIWSALAGAEQNVHHPISYAITQTCLQLGLFPQSVTNLSIRPREIRFTWKHCSWRFGANDSASQDADLCLEALDGPPQTARFQLKAEPARTVAAILETLALRGETHLLSGDAEFRVKTFAKRHKIPHAHFALTPQQKARYIEDLQVQGLSPLYFGDGYNDIQAMKAATFSLAAPHSAPAVRLAADAHVLYNDAKTFRSLFKASTQLKKRTRQNFAIAILYNLTVIPAALLGAFSPLLAAAAMLSVVVLITLNSTR
ncbi:E1-E2 ATPase subfamily, putative [Verrucomicrobiia bacterium DG1235]|nr:E1-E2 ATPase subfamily, putative [Verrucomicrobiae bacterium DG1235]